jgi:type I restriction enzyme M protein
MAISNFVKRIQDVMRNDSGVNGDAQRIEQIVWILFLKIYDAKEETWELLNDNYKSIIPEGLKWRDWAVDRKDGEALTGDGLLDFVNNTLFPTLKNLEIDENTSMSQVIVRYAFEDANNYQKDGVLLRQVVNIIDEIDFTEYKERHEFGAIYESFLKDLQSAGNAGEFYTPRAVTDFMVKVVKPVLGDKIGDFACGTGGFLTSALNELDKQVGNSLENREIYNKSVYGIEKKALPHMLCVTNMLIHDIDDPNILHGNALDMDYKDMRKMEPFDVILMNPPYGGSEKDSVKSNFPTELRSSETADLFMNVIMYRLKKNGRCAVIIPDGFLFGTDNAKYNIKKKLFSEFNVHTVVRMPHSVFAPYTSIRTNILFFDNTEPTKETWFYRVDMPEGYKNFSKTRPMKLDHFNDALNWWENREEIEVDGFPKAKRYSIDEIIERSYNIDLCGFPHEEEVILEPMDLIQEYQEKRASLNAEIDHVLEQITSMLGGKAE